MVWNAFDTVELHFMGANVFMNMFQFKTIAVIFEFIGSYWICLI